MSDADRAVGKGLLVAWAKSEQAKPEGSSPYFDYGSTADDLDVTIWSQRDSNVLIAFRKWWNGSGYPPPDLAEPYVGVGVAVMNEDDLTALKKWAVKRGLSFPPQLPFPLPTAPTPTPQPETQPPLPPARRRAPTPVAPTAKAGVSSGAGLLIAGGVAIAAVAIFAMVVSR